MTKIIWKNWGKIPKLKKKNGRKGSPKNCVKNPQILKNGRNIIFNKKNLKKLRKNPKISIKKWQQKKQKNCDKNPQILQNGRKINFSKKKIWKNWGKIPKFQKKKKIATKEEAKKNCG